MATWKRDFASGLIILVPLMVTVVVLVWIYGHLARIPLPVESGPIRVMLSLLIFILLVFGVGYLMRSTFGAVVERAIDDLMNQLPGLRVVYNASKMAVETALSGTSELQSPVRLEVWDGLRMTAFKTGKTTADGRDILFMPTAPNITTGFVIEVDPERYEEVDDSVEDALTRLLSAGFGDTTDDALGNMLDDRPTEPEPVATETAEQRGNVSGTESETASDGGDRQ